MAGPATDQQVEMWAGDTLTIRIPIKDTDGGYVDLGGATAKWWMGKNAKATGTDVYLKKSSASTMLCDDGVTRNQVEIDRETDFWVLLVHLKGDDTETGFGTNPKPATYYHEAEVIDADGNIATVTTGQFIIEPTLVRNPDNGG